VRLSRRLIWNVLPGLIAVGGTALETASSGRCLFTFVAVDAGIVKSRQTAPFDVTSSMKEGQFANTQSGGGGTAGETQGPPCESHCRKHHDAK
jgi:hypothetical protein